MSLLGFFAIQVHATVWGYIFTAYVVGVLLARRIAETVFVPLGATWATDRLYRIGLPMDGAHDRGSSIAFAVARATHGCPNEHDRRRVRNILDGCLDIGANGAAAAALLAESRGDRAHARALFEAVFAFGPRQGSVRAFRLAGEHLVLDALVRADWRTASALGQHRRVSRLTRLVAACADCMRRPPTERSAFRLWASWAFTRRRRATLAVVRAALAAPAPAPAAPVAATLDAVVALLAGPPGALGRADIEAAVRSLELLRTSSDWFANLQRRAMVVGGDAANVRDAIVRDAEDAIAGVVLGASLPVAWIPEHGTGADVRDRVRVERLHHAEVLVGELARRARARRDLPCEDEWRAWADARRALEDVRGSVSAQERLGLVLGPLTIYAVRLANIRSRRVLAGDVFRYVQQCTRDAGATAAHPHVDGNVAAVRAERLPYSKDIVGDPIGRFGFHSAWTVVTLLCAVAAAVALATTSNALRLSVFSLTTCISIASGAMVARRSGTCWVTLDGLVLQTRFGRHIASFDDVRDCRLASETKIRLRLRRAPGWLGHRFLLTTVSRNVAAATVERLRAATAAAQPETGTKDRVDLAAPAALGM